MGERQAAVRRCVEAIRIDHENDRATIGVRKLPLVLGGSQMLGVEHVIVGLA